MSRFLGITREPVFSPGRVQDDGAILEMVADRLRAGGQDVRVLAADAEPWPEPAAGTIVFTMCQGAPALQRLQQWQARGVRIVNCPEAILNCQRHRTVAAFQAAAIPFPETVLLTVGGEPPLPSWVANGGAWVKRGDVHATEADDVVAVDGTAAARRALQRFRERGIAAAVLQRHVAGTVVKFYAVRDGFFHCVRPLGGVEIPLEVLRRIAKLGQRAAAALNVEVYGGDCVYDVNGGVTLIDLNDWPSYAPCRAEGAAAIAAHLLAQDVATDT